MQKVRKSIKTRIREILEYVYSQPLGERVTQGQIMDAIQCSPGQWNEVREWLDLIFSVQSRPIDRDYIEIKAPKGKGRVVTYYFRPE